jgi:septum formation protein
MDPIVYVTRAAECKAAEVASRTADAIVLGVDTDVVAPDGTILGKPIDAIDARRMLRLLSGQTHHVYSSLCALRVESGIIRQRGARLVAVAVTFRVLDDSMIDAYLRTGEYSDKAGAYGIQGRAMAFVERLDGDLSAVIGLPLVALTDLLGEFGVPLWECPSALETPQEKAHTV